jgi:pimeloyl-ACP methyl ester carboxylesterase
MATRRQSRTRQLGIGVHTDEILKTHNQMLDPLPVRRRFVETRGGYRVHVVQAGEGPPAVFLHGANTSSLSFMSLLGLLDGVHGAAVDRPGRGLSDPNPVPRARFREAAIEFVDDVLDALEIDTGSLVGQSGGGVWTLWYAMARPERVRSIVLLGSVPLLPGTRCPAPLRVMATPGLGALLARVVRPTPRSLVRLLSSVGEGDTIGRYPDLINALVAGGSDPVASAADLAELRAAIQPFGFRRSMLLGAEELQAISAPTLFIWGDHDPVGSVEVARAAAQLIPNARLEVLPAGHVPQLGHPQRVAALLSNFLGPAGRP